MKPVLQIHHRCEQVRLRSDRMGHKVSIDEDVVGRSEGGVGGEEHVRRGIGDVSGHFVLGFVVVFLVAGSGLLDALIALGDSALHLRGRVALADHSREDPGL